MPLILADLLKNVYDVKSNEIKVEIYGNARLATTSALHVIDNKTSDVSNLLKKTDDDANYQILSRNILPHLIIMNL